MKGTTKDYENTGKWSLSSGWCDVDLSPAEHTVKEVLKGNHMHFSFESFVNGNYDWDADTKRHTGIWLRAKDMDIGGGRIKIEDIDELSCYPEADTVTISGLRQDTFEYFIEHYGKQLKAIRFFKNKMIEDFSILGSLDQLEYLDFFANQRVTSLWNMQKNESLIGLNLDDFSRLKSIDGVQTAPKLAYFFCG